MYYNKRTYEESNQSQIKESYSGYAGTICPFCLKPNIIKLSWKYNMQLIEIPDVEEPAFGATITVNLTCPGCGNFYSCASFLDPNITSIIAELNRKGYHTIFSCEGHDNSSYKDEYGEDIGYSQPYIYFTKDGGRKVLRELHKYPLPNPWFLDMTDFNDGRKIIIRCKDDSSNFNKVKERLEPLAKWVDSLPISNPKLK